VAKSSNKKRKKKRSSGWPRGGAAPRGERVDSIQSAYMGIATGPHTPDDFDRYGLCLEQILKEWHEVHLELPSVDDFIDATAHLSDSERESLATPESDEPFARRVRRETFPLLFPRDVVERLLRALFAAEAHAKRPDEFYALAIGLAELAAVHEGKTRPEDSNLLRLITGLVWDNTVQVQAITSRGERSGDAGASIENPTLLRHLLHSVNTKASGLLEWIVDGVVEAPRMSRALARLLRDAEGPPLTLPLGSDPSEQDVAAFTGRLSTIVTPFLSSPECESAFDDFLEHMKARADEADPFLARKLRSFLILADSPGDTRGQLRGVLVRACVLRILEGASAPEEKGEPAG